MAKLSAQNPPAAWFSGPASSPEIWRALLRHKHRESYVRVLQEMGRLVQEMRKTGVDRNTVSVDGSSIVGHALAQQALWAVPFLLRSGFRPRAGEPFLTTVLTFLPGHWKEAWSAWADASERNAAGETPLHCASAKAKIAAVSVLLAAGADPNARDKAGRTPLHRVWGRRHVGRHCTHAGESVQASVRLLAAGARWDIGSAQGDTPFHSLLESFPKRSTPPNLDWSTAFHAANALNHKGVHPLSLILRASTAELAAYRDQPFTRNPASPQPWITLLAGLGANSGSPNADGTTPSRDFAAWRTEAQRTTAAALRNKETVAALESLWVDLELQAALPKGGGVRRRRM